MIVTSRAASPGSNRAIICCKNALWRDNRDIGPSRSGLKEAQSPPLAVRYGQREDATASQQHPASPQPAPPSKIRCAISRIWARPERWLQSLLST